MKSRGIFYMMKRDTKHDIKHRRDEFTSRRRFLLFRIRFCYSLFIILDKHHRSTPTVPLSLKNPQRYQRPEFAAAYSHLTICIAPSLNPDRPSIPQKSATLSKVGICNGSQPSAVNATKAYIHLFKRQI